jgi:XTP/dITP diphosphohydrolase
MTRELVLASANPGKKREIKALVEPLSFKLITAAELGFKDEIAETGESFAENARLKACAVAKALKRPALADDSGLVVEALKGAPGVKSARYAGEGAGDEANWQKLLAALKGVPPASRSAAFVCVMACCRPDGRVLLAEGRLAGRIALGPAGTGGFGYDPVFELPERGCTVAQLSPAEKNAISHRAQALRKLVAELSGFLRE